MAKEVRRIKYGDFVKTYSKFYYSSKYYLEIMQKFKSGWTINRISRDFGMYYQTVWAWVKKKSVPVPFVEYQKIKKEFNEKEINNLSSVIGYLFGDGGITNRGVIHYCNSEKFLINQFISSMSKVFDEQPTNVKQEEGITRVKYSAKIGKSLWCLFGKFSFGKDTKTITPQIQNMPLEWKAKMLISWFNDDGSVPKYGVVAIKQKLKPLILFIQNTLSELGIKSIITGDDGRWQLRICSYRYLIIFKEKINFSEGYRKRQKLDEVINNKKDPHFVTKNKILELLKKSSRTRKELSESLNLESGTISGHLHGWKRKPGKKKSTKGLVDLGLVEVRKEGRKSIYSLEDTRKTVIDSF